MNNNRTGEETMQQAVANVQEKIGAAILLNDDVVVLACAEIAKTYSRDEKGYA